MLEALGQEDLAGNVYKKIYAECTELGQPPMYPELIALASRAYESGSQEEGKGFLLQIPVAIAEEVGATGDLCLASKGQTPKLRGGMEHLASVVVQHATSFDDVRLIAELQRDVIGRAQYLRLAGQNEIERVICGVGAREIASIANEQYPVAVIEWVEPAGFIGCLITIVSSDRGVKSAYLDPPGSNLQQLAEKMRTRLSNWYIGRPGDPFDLPEWKACEDWLVRQVSPHLPNDGHLVVIEHASNIGILWHVAGRRWTCSYAASWSSLLIVREAIEPRQAAIGQILVPKAFESEEVEKALRESADRTRGFAKSHGLCLIEEVEGQQADRNRFEEIMRSVTVAKLLCHGFFDPEERQIALLLAHQGELPLLSAASRSRASRAHRFTWEDCLTLNSAPVAVFSAACSTGVSQIIGMGERLGLFAGLRRLGTQVFIAPMWDAVAESVLSILDDAMEHYLSGESVARAVHNACLRAEERCPTWLAWNLMVGGNWDEHI